MYANFSLTNRLIAFVVIPFLVVLFSVIFIPVFIVCTTWVWINLPFRNPEIVYGVGKVQYRYGWFKF